MLFYLLSLGGAGVPCWTADSFIEQTDITLFRCETGQAEQTRYAYLEVYTWLIMITFCVFNICCIYCCIKAVSHSRLQYTIYHSDMSAVEFLHDIYCWKRAVLMRSVWAISHCSCGDSGLWKWPSCSHTLTIFLQHFCSREMKSHAPNKVSRYCPTHGGEYSHIE